MSTVSKPGYETPEVELFDITMEKVIMGSDCKADLEPIDPYCHPEEDV